ncbi:hypothetical protein HZ326_2848 [Fusarium oxysporum f. sp. albedinis]|nr:hypothetical protein HZ326_2848 [Fusarium oxysporum f. sp. albedinis]
MHKKVLNSMDVHAHDITLTSSPFPKPRPILAASPALASTETPVMPAGTTHWNAARNKKVLAVVGPVRTDRPLLLLVASHWHSNLPCPSFSHRLLSFFFFFFSSTSTSFFPLSPLFSVGGHCV